MIGMEKFTLWAELILTQYSVSKANQYDQDPCIVCNVKSSTNFSSNVDKEAQIITKRMKVMIRNGARLLQ